MLLSNRTLYENKKNPANAGPITLEALKDAEFRPIALANNARGTTIETKTSLTGW